MSRECLPLGFLHIPLQLQVALIAHKDLFDAGVSVVAHQLHSFGDVLESLPPGDVVDQKDGAGVFNVVGLDVEVGQISGCVPYVDVDCFPVYVHPLLDVLDADGGV